MCNLIRSLLSVTSSFAFSYDWNPRMLLVSIAPYVFHREEKVLACGHRDSSFLLSASDR